MHDFQALLTYLGKVSFSYLFPVDTGRKLNVHKTFRRRPGCLLNVLCTFSLRPVPTGLLCFFFYVNFLSRKFAIHRTAGEGRGYLFNSSLPFPPTLQTLRHQPGDCCRELISTHSQQPDSNREPLVSERKSLTTKLLQLDLETSVKAENV